MYKNHQIIAGCTAASIFHDWRRREEEKTTAEVVEISIRAACLFSLKPSRYTGILTGKFQS